MAFSGLTTGKCGRNHSDGGLAYFLGFFGYIFYLSSNQPSIGKPVPASHLTLTSSRLYECTSLPSVGLAVSLPCFQGTATSYFSPSQTWLTCSLYQSLVSPRESGCSTCRVIPIASRVQNCFSRYFRSPSLHSDCCMW